PIRSGKDAASVQQAADALRQAQIFLSDVSGPPDTDDEQRRLTSTLHALDHASRLTEVASGGINFGSMSGGPEDIRAGELCTEAMQSAAGIAHSVAAPPRDAGSPLDMPSSPGADTMGDPRAISTDETIAALERYTTQLGEMLRTHRSAT